MRVVFLRSNPVDPDPRVEKEALTLARAGYDVEIVAWQRTATDAMAKPETVTADIGGYSVPIHRFPIPASFGGGLGNLRGMARWQSVLWRWLRRNRDRYDAIHACDFDTILPAIMAKRLYGKRVVYDIFDFYVDAFNVPRRLTPCIRRVDFGAINAADAVIVASDHRVEQIRGSRPRRLQVIHNTPMEMPSVGTAVDRCGASLTIGYVGILSPHRFLLEMVDLVRQHPDWRLLIAGFGEYALRIDELADAHANIVSFGRVPYSEAMAINAASDIMFAIYDPVIPNHRISAPNKLYEAMMLGRPILVAENTGIDQIVRKHGCGSVVDYYSPDKVGELLVSLQANPSQMHEMAARGRDAYDREYSWAVMERRLLELYGALS